MVESFIIYLNILISKTFFIIIFRIIFVLDLQFQRFKFILPNFFCRAFKIKCFIFGDNLVGRFIILLIFIFVGFERFFAT